MSCAAAASSSPMAATSFRRAAAAVARNGVPSIPRSATAIATASPGVRLTGGSVRLRSRQ